MRIPANKCSTPLTSISDTSEFPETLYEPEERKQRDRAWVQQRKIFIVLAVSVA